MIEFKLPSLGADMDEGTLLEWKVKPGDAVKKGQVIAVVDTTKAAVDVECWQEGTVHELVAEAGDKMPVGTVMATLLEPGEKSAPAGRRKRSPAAAAVAAPTARRMVSPAARKHARSGASISSGRRHRPGRRGNAGGCREAAAQPAPAPAPTASRPTRPPKCARPSPPRWRAPSAKFPTTTSPRTYRWRRRWRGCRQRTPRRPMAERLLPAALLLKAVATPAQAIRNSMAFGATALSHRPHINLGVAISLRQGGLIAPALLDAGGKPMTQLMQELTDLVKRTRAGSLKSSEMSEATITVTNLGDQGSSQCSA